MPKIVTAAVVVFLLVACAALPHSTPTAAPSPTMACPAGLLTGVLAEQAGELVVVADDGSFVERVKWPSGHSVRRDGDMLVLVNESDVVVAREGDSARLGGGELSQPGTWDVCGLLEVVT